MSKLLGKVVGGVYDELYYQWANKSTWKERFQIARRSKKAIAEAEKKRKEAAAKAAEKKDEAAEAVESVEGVVEKVQGEIIEEPKVEKEELPEKVISFINSKSDNCKNILLARADITNEMVKFVAWYIGSNGSPCAGYTEKDQKFINGLISYMKDNYPDDVQVELPYPEAGVERFIEWYDISSVNHLDIKHYIFDSNDLLARIRKNRNALVMVNNTIAREIASIVEPKKETTVNDVTAETTEETKHIEVPIEEVVTPQFHKIEPDKVVPFKISEPTQENTFIFKDGTIEDNNEETVVDFTGEEKQKLDQLSAKIVEYLGEVPIRYIKTPEGIVDMYILRPNGYTDNYAVDINGLISGGTKTRIAVTTPVGISYIPIDMPEAKKALENKFYMYTEDELKEMDKVLFPLPFYDLIDFSALNDIEDVTVLRTNLGKVLDAIASANGGNIPRTRLIYNNPEEFRLLSDEKVKTPFQGMASISNGFKAKYSHGKIKIRGEEE